MKEFVKFEEHNDHEGESWVFWLQYDGNEKELDKLKKFLSDYNIEDNPGYELDLTPVPEKEVDIVVKHTSQGYMDYHNKVEGTFTMPEFELDEGYDEDEAEEEAWEFANDTFYKGDIARHFK